LVKVTSDDVIHRWRLPSLGIKMDAVPGRINEIVLGNYLNLFGVYKGQCSEICGVYHSKMPIMVVCLPLRQ
jgi:heme/copper-type cytochrome/quinol oxidase subunit 2